MSVLSNAGIRAGAVAHAAASSGGDDDAYQIAKSIKLYSEDSAHFKRYSPGVGNRKVFTISWWQKKYTKGTRDNKNCGVISSHMNDNNHFVLGFENSGQMHFDNRVNTNPISNMGTGSYIFSDISAWMHVCYVCDTTHSNAEDRQRVYINGKRRFEAATDYSSNVEGIWNRATTHHYLGYMPQGNWGYPELGLADVHHIDGYAVGPSAFGKFDAAGNWVAKKFAMPAPNDGTTWSNYGTWSGDNSSDRTNLFDGNLSTYHEASSSNTSMVWTPTKGIPITATLRLYLDVNGTHNPIKINDKTALSEADSGDGWNEIPGAGIVYTSLDKLEIKKGGSSYAKVAAIEIDGVVLRDGQTDLTTYDNPNDGTQWSTAGTDVLDSGNTEDGAIANLFDGDTSTRIKSHFASSGGAVGKRTYTFPGSGIPFQKLRVYAHVDNSGQSDINIYVNNVKQSFADGTEGWVTPTGVTSPITSVATTIKSHGGWAWCKLGGIEINDQVLIDYCHNNSFQLNFGDARSLGLIGKDTFNSTLAGKACLPILKTKAGTHDQADYGDVVDTGYTDDSSAGTTDGTGLVLAIPGNALTDYASFADEHVDDASYAFNGSTSGTYATAGAGTTGTFTFTGSKFTGITKLRIYGRYDSRDNAADSKILVNDADIEVGSSAAWVTATEHLNSGTLNTIKIVSDSYLTALWAIEIDDVIVQTGDDLDVHASINTGSSAVTGTLNGNPSLDTVQSRLYGTSLAFDGNDTVSFPASADFDFGSGNATVETWVYIDSFAADKTIGGIWTGWQLSYGTGGGSNKFSFMMYDGSNTVSADSVLKASDYEDQWVHVAGVRDGNTLKIFVNGSFQGKATFTGAHSTTSGTTLYIGGRASGNYITGSLNDFRIYKGVAKYTGNFKCPFRNDFKPQNVSIEAGQNYTSYWGGTGSTGNIDNGGNAFNGSDSNYASNANSNTICNWVPPSGIAYTDLEIKFGAISNGNNQVFVNGTAQNVTNSGGQTYTASNGTLTSVGVQDIGSTHGRIYYIKIDGSYLVDGYPTDMDSHNDSPTNYIDASDGQHGNYCTLNPFDIESNSGSHSVQQGNLLASGSSSSGSWHKGRSTFTIPKGNTGKWYYEATVLLKESGVGCDIGFDDPTDHTIFAGGMGDSGYASWCFKDIGQKRTGGTSSSYGNALSANDTVGVGYDNGSIYFWINGTIQNSGTAAFTGVSANLCPTYSMYTESNKNQRLYFNFGQHAFKNLPSGYKGYCTANLVDTFNDTTNANNPSAFFNSRTWVGTGAAGYDIEGFGFQPDLVWLKRLDSAGGHHVRDAIRGATKSWFPNTNEAEGTDANIMSAFLSDGFTLGNGDNTNSDGGRFIGWGWDVGTAAATASTAGDVTPSAQWVNDAAGISISTWAGNDTNPYTVGHGLSTKPDFIIIKRYSTGSSGNFVYHSSLGAEKYLELDVSNAAGDDTGIWNDTEPDNQKFTVGNWNMMDSGQNLLAYCFTAKPGYSAFGSYTGNAAGNGPYIHLGFQPRLVIFKNTNTSNGWRMMDTRDSYIPNNPTKFGVYPQLNNEEDSPDNWKTDYLSNGFRILDNNNELNGSGNKIIYAAWADQPFKTARAI